ncbi:MAG: hypothetical protein E6H08_02995 [Bacteroidetes bacterium]|nr:MAG: hypothetical protein E6H08_02995 [Bacteroidota bacterium]
MKRSKTIIYLTIGLMIITSCNDQTETQSQDNKLEDTTKSHETVIEKSPVEKETYSFQKTLEFKNISFEINTKGNGSLRQLFIQSKGFEETNKRLELQIDGKVTDAQVADLNADGFPELLIFTQSAGSGTYGNVIAFSANGTKSLSQVYFPPVSENPKLKKGYMGHDTFSVNGSALIQEFPIYKAGDPNSNPTGGIRRIQYKLVNGEATRKFVADKISESPSK